MWFYRGGGWRQGDKRGVQGEGGGVYTRTKFAVCAYPGSSLGHAIACLKVGVYLGHHAGLGGRRVSDML